MDEIYRIANEYYHICEKDMFRESANKSLDIYSFVVVPILYIIALLANNNLGGYSNVLELNVITGFLFIFYMELMILFWLGFYRLSKQDVFISKINKNHNTSFGKYDDAKQFILSHLTKKSNTEYLDYHHKIKGIKKEWDNLTPSNAIVLSNIILLFQDNILTRIMNRIFYPVLVSVLVVWVNEKYQYFSKIMSTESSFLH